MVTFPKKYGRDARESHMGFMNKLGEDIKTLHDKVSGDLGLGEDKGTRMAVYLEKNHGIPYGTLNITTGSKALKPKTSPTPTSTGIKESSMDSVAAEEIKIDDMDMVDQWMDVESVGNCDELDNSSKIKHNDLSEHFTIQRGGKIQIVECVHCRIRFTIREGDYSGFIYHLGKTHNISCKNLNSPPSKVVGNSDELDNSSKIKQTLEVSGNMNLQLSSKPKSTRNLEGKQTVVQNSDGLSEVEWSSFAAFINSGDASNANEDLFEKEPSEDDYVRYFDFLWEVKNQKSSNLWSTFLRMSECHKRKYGRDVQEIWTKIKQMLENNIAPELAISDKVATCPPEKSKKVYESMWKEFLAFLGKDDEPTEDDYLKFFNYLAEEKHLQSSSLWSARSRLMTGHEIHYGKSIRHNTPKLLQGGPFGRALPFVDTGCRVLP